MPTGWLDGELTHPTLPIPPQGGWAALPHVAVAGLAGNAEVQSSCDSSVPLCFLGLQAKEGS